MKRSRPPLARVPAGVTRRLARAVAARTLVRVERSVEGADAIEGFVLGSGDAWTLLAPCADVRVDGYTAVRTGDISRVKRRGDENALTVRALRRRGQWPVAAPAGGVRPGDTAELLTTAAAHYGLLGVHTEHLTVDSLWIGALLRVGPRSARLHLIDPEARWYDRPSKVRLADLTRIGFGGRYEETLREFAEPRPGWPPDPKAAPAALSRGRPGPSPSAG